MFVIFWDDFPHVLVIFITLHEKKKFKSDIFYYKMSIFFMTHPKYGYYFLWASLIPSEPSFSKINDRS